MYLPEKTLTNEINQCSSSIRTIYLQMNKEKKKKSEKVHEFCASRQLEVIDNLRHGAEFTRTSGCSQRDHVHHVYNRTLRQQRPP